MMDTHHRSARQQSVARRAMLWQLLVFLSPWILALAQQQKQSNILLEGAVLSVTVRSGAEMASAFADTRVTLINIDVPDLLVKDQDWLNYSTPVVLERNVTVTGAANMAFWPALRLHARKKLQLGPSINLIFTHVVLDRVRLQADNILRSAGFDIMVPCPSDPGGIVQVVDAALTIATCFPPDVIKENIRGTARPQAFPGNHTADVNLPQPGCYNDSSKPWLGRCWAGRGLMIDMALFGADIDALGKPQPNNYTVLMRNMQWLCWEVLSSQCVAEKGPIGCMLASRKHVNGTADLLQADAKDYGGNAESVLVPVLISTTGAAFLVAAVVAGWRCSRRRRLRMQALELPAVKSYGSQVEDGCKSMEADVIGDRGGSSSSPMIGLHLDMEPQTGTEVLMGTGEVALMSVVTPETPYHPSVNLRIEVMDGRAATMVSASVVNPFFRGVSCTNEMDGGDDESARVLVPNPGDDDIVKMLPAVCGKGAFGRVVEGMYRGQRVAVKHLLDEHDLAAAGNRDALLQALMQEVEVLARCQHPNIVRLIAACVRPPRLGLVMELMETSLDKMMYGQQALLPLRLVLHIAIEIAKGLEYLHPTVIHRDLKPANVLINDPWGERTAVKITDFGLSRLRNTILVTANPEVGTPAYMAPECFDLQNFKMSISHKSDIFSFGVLLWEMLAGSQPWAKLDMVQIAVRVVVKGERLQRLPEARFDEAPRWVPKLQQIVERCWDADPRRRPAAAELVKKLMLLVQEINTEAESVAVRSMGMGMGIESKY